MVEAVLLAGQNGLGVCCHSLEVWILRPQLPGCVIFCMLLSLAGPVFFSIRRVG